MLAFEYLRRDARAAGVLGMEEAFGGNSRGVIRGEADANRNWHRNIAIGPVDDEVRFVGMQEGSQPRVSEDSTLSEALDEAVVILPQTHSRNAVRRQQVDDREKRSSPRWKKRRIVRSSLHAMR